MIILFWLLYFLRPINVITKTTYNSQSYNSSDALILVYSAGLQFRLFLFSSLLSSYDCSQPASYQLLLSSGSL